MFCPHCGIDEQQPKQFCRACGADLRVVRTALHHTDDFSASAISAREEIGHAFALKIKELQSVKDLKKIAEDTLPQIEKFLESPEEKRLRRLRTGVSTATIGLAAIMMGLLLGGITHDREWGVLGAIGFVPLLVGLGIVVNGLFFSAPRKRGKEAFAAAAFVQSLSPAKIITNELPTSEITSPATSITDHTTHKLPDRAR